MSLAILVIILIINLIVALVYLFHGLVRFKDREKDRGHRAKYIMAAFVMIVCPLTGPLFMGVSHVLYIILSKRDVDMSDVSFDRSKMKNYTPADLERDINIVPMQETLIVSDVGRRRKMLLDVLKKDIRRSLGSIAIALDNPDSETSHYAASVIMDALSEFRGNVQNMHDKLKNDPEEHELAGTLLAYINDVLRQHILAEDEQKRYTYIEDEIGDLMFRHHPECIEGYQYRCLLEDLTDIKDFSAADKWARRAVKNREYQLDTYIGCLKYYYAYNDRDAFMKCLDRLKASGIVVDKDTMELIRIFR